MARPLKYKTVAELESAIEKYFKDCEGEILRDKDGQPMLDKFNQPIVYKDHPPTVTGLALALGFATRKSLLEYQGRKEFVNAITRAKARCEEYAESRLYDRDGVRGARFSLEHNFKWKDPPAEETQKANNMQALADVIQRPVPNRNIKDFEE